MGLSPRPRGSLFGRLPDGTEVARHTLIRGSLRLELAEYGATVLRLVVDDARGHPRNVVLGHSGLEEYAASTAYLGCVVGRYANRIAGGRFALDGRTVELGANQGGHTLHGGPDGFHRRVWSTTARSEASVTFSLVSPDGDQGFPGTLRAEVRYTVGDGEVGIDYEAVTDAPTVVSLTNHAYFHLDGEGSGAVDDHRLAVAADRFTPTDARGLPTGAIEAVDGTAVDLREERRVGDVVRSADPVIGLVRGLDHNFAIRGRGLRHAATLRSPRSGISLRVESDRPGLQVYTGNFLDGTLVGTSGRRYRQGDGIALESQAFPDAPNQPAFPSAVLRPGAVYRSRTVWRLGTDQPG